MDNPTPASDRPPQALRVLLISSEAAPYSKSGGLGDVVGALALALTRRGHRVLVVTPAYQHSQHQRTGAQHEAGEAQVRTGHGQERVTFERIDSDGVTWLFARHPVFDREGMYGDDRGTFGDNHLRALLLCDAALQAARVVHLDADGPLGERIVVHAHDWQGALAPLLLEARYHPFGAFHHAASVLTLHNVAHQGRSGAEHFADLALHPRWFAPDALEWHGDLCLLKGGVARADEVTTVSPSYARELCTPHGAHGLHDVISQRGAHLTGILNGIDADVWSPQGDPLIAARYSADDLSGKALCKGALQAELGLPVNPRVPLIGFIGRLDPQKGVEMLTESVPWMVDQGAQVVFLGSANPAHANYEDTLRALEHAHPQAVRAWIGYNEAIAHRIEAGVDLFAMPSRFEPCGLNQLYSMAYGTVPVVRAVGGLRDSVAQATPSGDAGTGWLFDDPSGHALRTSLWSALETWRHRPEAFRAIQRRGMRSPVTWEHRVPAYEDVYRRALASRAP